MILAMALVGMHQDLLQRAVQGMEMMHLREGVLLVHMTPSRV